MNEAESLRFLISELQQHMDAQRVRIAYQVAGSERHEVRFGGDASGWNADAALATIDDAHQLFSVFRALCNMRMPGPVSDRFLHVQDRLLQNMTAEKGVTDARSISRSAHDTRLSVWQGDITTIRADAIVNAANAQMLGCFRPLHNCIDNQIHTMAGVQLRNECADRLREMHVDELPVATPLVTRAYNLPATHVIHIAGPIVTGSLQASDEEKLAQCYMSCLDRAESAGCESIAFCCISTGVYMFPPKDAARIAVTTVQEYLDRHEGGSVNHVVFNVFKDSDLRIYESLLGR